jgi:hypothetical protein
MVKDQNSSRNPCYKTILTFTPNIGMDIAKGNYRKQSKIGGFKMNKKMMMLLVIMALVLIPVVAQDTANGNGYGSGNGQNGNGNGSGNGNENGNGTPIHNLYDGTPFSFSGTVISCEMTGNGLLVSTENGNLAVTGLGPFHYWDSLGVAKPVVGDMVSGNGYTVDYNGIVRNVLTDITVNGITVELRDANGWPLWRGSGAGNGGNPGQGGGYMGLYYHILNGTPFTYEGEVISTCVTGLGIRGDGLVIATTEGNIEVHGLGPVHYWEHLELSKPAVGDTVTVSGFTVDFNGTTVNVLISIVLGDGTSVQLRDPETGAPLWRGSGRNN